MLSRWIHGADDRRRRLVQAPSYRRTASSDIAQNMLGSLFTGTADDVVNDMAGQRAAGAVYEEPVFPDHAASLWPPGVDASGGQFLFDKLLEIAFERQPDCLCLRQQ